MEQFVSVFTDPLSLVFGALTNDYKNKPINFVMSVCPHVTTRQKKSYLFSVKPDIVRVKSNLIPT